MELLSSWAVPVVAVGALGGATLALAVLVGRWIDAQSNSVVDEPKQERKRSSRAAKGGQ